MYSVTLYFRGWESLEPQLDLQFITSIYATTVHTQKSIDK